MNVNDDKRIRKALERACPDGIRINESMAKHTTIGVGGPARFFALPRHRREIASVTRVAIEWNIDFVGIGRGSNLLVRDGGFDGLIIKVAGNVGELRVYRRTAHADAGVSFTRLGRVLTRAARPGFEFAVGIPGSVGGAVRMNAGAWGCDVAGVLKSVKIIDREGRIAVLTPDQLGFGYRKSGLPRGSIILSAVFHCPVGTVNMEMLKRSMSRHETQPLSQRSFGSTFKNPRGKFAAELIDSCGLKGTRRGGVKVSEKHANFLVNVGKDTRANDIEDLIDVIKKRVKARFDVTLAPEVIIIGDR